MRLHEIIEHGTLLSETDNRNLIDAKRNKHDEYYTQYSDIENELKYYSSHFQNKIVFCNCDNYVWSKFFWYFAKNFNKLNLKRLITTSYKENTEAERVIIDDLPQSRGLVNDRDIFAKLNEPNVVAPLGGNGDFRSPESIALLKQADIVVTNPPFSLFTEFVDILTKYKKQFLIMGSHNACKYTNMSDLIINKKAWLGIHNKEMRFRIPDEYISLKKGIKTNKSGENTARIGGISWYTNLDHGFERPRLLDTLKFKYNPELHPTYDNANAIEACPISIIPIDFADLMGVPISFLAKHNPEEFELIGTNASLGFGKLTINKQGKFSRFFIRNLNPLPPGHILPECDTVTELKRLFGSNYEQNGNDMIWQINPETMIIYEPNNNIPLRFEGPKRFKISFDAIIRKLKNKGCIN